MKFRFYITNTFNGNVEGTNDQNKAEELAACEEYFIVDADSGEWLKAMGNRVPVEEPEA
jgi:hypothetical protein